MAKEMNSKNRGRRNYRGGGRKGKDRSDYEKKDYTNGGGSWEDNKSNDVAWYQRNSTMFTEATRVPFAEVEGAKADLRNTFWVEDPENYLMQGGVQDGTYAGPCLMRINYVPGIGVSETFTSAANRAFTSIYSAITSKTANNVNFPQYALAMYIMAGQSIAQNIGIAKRALGLSYLWSSWNLNYPNKVLKALGFKPESIVGKQDEIIWRLQAIISMFNTMRIPNFVDVYKRHYAMSSNIYLDQDNIKAQLYAFVPEVSYLYSDLGIYDYDTSEYDGNAAAVPVKHPCQESEGIDMQDYLDHIEMQIEWLRGSHDFGMINGALTRAFDESAFVSIEAPGLDFRVMPVVDETIGYQIHNAVFTGDIVWHPRTVKPGYRVDVFSRGYIQGDRINNVITYSPHIEVNASPRFCSADNGYIINSYKESVSPEEVMEYTRLMSDWVLDGDYIRAKSLGTEFCTTFVVYIPTTEDVGMDLALKNNGVFKYDNANIPIPLENYFLQVVTAMSRFHKAPFYRIGVKSSMDATKWSLSTPIGDLNNWTKVDSNALRHLNDTAIMSIFSTEVPIHVK